MNRYVGFVIISHSELSPLERLVGALNCTYEEPPITIHHDFSQSDIDVTRLSGNVRFVRPSLKTGWGLSSVIQATLSALRELYKQYDPDWFTLLSASDYPIMPGRTAANELRESAFDLYMDFTPVEREPTTEAAIRRSRIGTDRAKWRRMAYDRYVAKTIRYPSLTRDLRPVRRRFLIRNESLLRNFIPYSAAWQCYAGDHWFTGNRKIADILLSDTLESRKTFNHLRERYHAEESYYHTVLCNRTDVEVCTDNKRYTDWLGQSDSHPRLLDINDLDAMLGSGCHFARKFSAERPSPVLDALDRVIAG
jgi:Core-2/I-Branching enzyme